LAYDSGCAESVCDCARTFSRRFGGLLKLFLYSFFQVKKSQTPAVALPSIVLDGSPLFFFRLFSPPLSSVPRTVLFFHVFGFWACIFSHFLRGVCWLVAGWCSAILFVGSLASGGLLGSMVVATLFRLWNAIHTFPFVPFAVRPRQGGAFCCAGVFLPRFFQVIR